MSGGDKGGKGSQVVRCPAAVSYTVDTWYNGSDWRHSSASNSGLRLPTNRTGSDSTTGSTGSKDGRMNVRDISYTHLHCKWLFLRIQTMAANRDKIKTGPEGDFAVYFVRSVSVQVVTEPFFQPWLFVLGLKLVPIQTWGNMPSFHVSASSSDLGSDDQLSQTYPGSTWRAENSIGKFPLKSTTGLVSNKYPVSLFLNLIAFLATA